MEHTGQGSSSHLAHHEPKRVNMLQQPGILPVRLMLKGVVFSFLGKHDECKEGGGGRVTCIIQGALSEP